MIDPICFEEPWLRDVKSKINPAVDIVLLERMIYAFELLGQITKVKNDFIFKGGTSLVLLIPEVKRLSIDIDVVGEFTEDELLPVIENSIFNELAEDIRENTEIPKKHYKFFYNSKLDDIERYILLDILGSDNPYSNVTESIISNPLFNTVEELKVKTPSIDDILGDKLTAFAPHTIGIPFGINKALEIIKQLYDINNLFDLLSDIKVVNSAYKNISENESGYRGLSSDLQVHLIDSFQTSAKLCRLDFKGSVEDDETIELRKGIRAISGFLLNNDFNFSTAKTAASKVALLSSLLKFPDNEINFDDLRFDDTKLKVLKDFQLPPELNLLNTLKRTNIEAFYYWYLITKITEDLSWIDL
jgi:predicted nucleotidyltransferase component of viral defense system